MEGTYQPLLHNMSTESILDRATLEKHVFSISQKVDEIKSRVYETINKHFIDFSYTYGIIAEQQEELEEVMQMILNIKQQAQVHFWCVRRCHVLLHYILCMTPKITASFHVEWTATIEAACV